MTKCSGKGSIDFDNGKVYVGEYKDSLPHGRGRMKYNGGRIVNGFWQNGENIYDGELNDEDNPHGRGKLNYSEHTYAGEWVNGKRHGKGVQKWPKGHSYEGEWRDNKHHGEGKFNWPNGNSYEGQWVNGVMNGKGVMTYANHDIYDGEWKEGLEDGEGIIKYANGDVYKGGFSQGENHGHGVFEYAEGDLLKSTGEWKDGNKCGKFEEVPRAEPMKVYYNQNGEVEIAELVEERIHVYDEDTDTEYFPPSKGRHVSF